MSELLQDTRVHLPKREPRSLKYFSFSCAWAAPLLVGQPRILVISGTSLSGEESGSRNAPTPIWWRFASFFPDQRRVRSVLALDCREAGCRYLQLFIPPTQLHSLRVFTLPVRWCLAGGTLCYRSCRPKSFLPTGSRTIHFSQGTARHKRFPALCLLSRPTSEPCWSRYRTE